MRASRFIFPVLATAAVVVFGWRMQRDRDGADVVSGAMAVSEAPGNTGRAAPVHAAVPAEDAVSGTAGAAPASLPDEVRRMLAVNGTRSRADFVQLSGLVQRAVRELEGAERDALLREAGAWAARQNVAWGLELAAGLGDFRACASLVGAMVETAVGLDPQVAAAWVAEVTEPALRAGAYQAIASKWAETDLAGARAWAANLAEAAARSSAFEGLMWTWAQRDGKSAYEWAVGIAEPEIRDQVFVKMAKMMAVQEPRQALNWALQFPEGPARDQALHYAIFQWAAQDLTAAAEWSAKLTDRGLQAGSDVAIARSWSNQEAQGATVWAAGIADPAGRAVALATTVRKWAETNPAAAAEWIAQQAPTPAHEALFRSVTSALANTHPAATGIWLNGVADPAWRAAGERILAQRLEDMRAKGAVPKG